MKRRERKKFNVDVGFRLRQARGLNGLTQEYVGEQVGVTKQTINRYETGEIPVPTETLARCARLMDTPVGFFLGEQNEQRMPSQNTRVGLMVAAEIMNLPDDRIRKSVYHLVRAINQREAEYEDLRKAS